MMEAFSATRIIEREEVGKQHAGEKRTERQTAA